MVGPGVNHKGKMGGVVRGLTTISDRLSFERRTIKYLFRTIAQYNRWQCDYSFLNGHIDRSVKLYCRILQVVKSRG